ncbi:hypothetical protein POTOM_003788 [Populus tomentosa]|uniref:Chalcone/stilbene synthase N-terminal domain-containing protein n=1 Tax=Populus tomentosa TaxID=118781 RepID=A0A8X8AP53_POPTO|nr:hypothetical protein POTOM_003788 [Populus tomentosa]
MYLNEDTIMKNPSLSTYDAASLDARQEILVTEVPKLGKEAALKAIEEWGQPKSKITHLIFCTSSGIHIPGADHELTKLPGLERSVKRFMIYVKWGCPVTCIKWCPRLLRKALRNAWWRHSVHDMGSRTGILCFTLSILEFEEHIDFTKDKLRATRNLLTEYGNMWSPSVFFVLDEMRRRSAKEGKATTGEGLDPGVLFGFGPGVTSRP